MRLTNYNGRLLCLNHFCINLNHRFFHLQASLWSFAPQSSGTFSAVNIIQLYFENVQSPFPDLGECRDQTASDQTPKTDNLYPSNGPPR